jgi:hypothetical protein
MKVDFLRPAEVVAVMNLRRHPDTWKSRIRPEET